MQFNIGAVNKSDRDKIKLGGFAGLFSETFYRKIKSILQFLDMDEDLAFTFTEIGYINYQTRDHLAQAGFVNLKGGLLNR